MLKALFPVVTEKMRKVTLDKQDLATVGVHRRIIGLSQLAATAVYRHIMGVHSYPHIDTLWEPRRFSQLAVDRRTMGAQGLSQASHVDALW